MDYESWVAFFGKHQPRSQTFSDATVRQYAASLKSWLVFAGLLELHPRGVARADGSGAQMGVVSANRIGGTFLGTAAPARLEDLLRRVFASDGTLTRAKLEAVGLRNAVGDAIALGLLDAGKGVIALRPHVASVSDLLEHARGVVARQPTVRLAVEHLRAADGDKALAGERLGVALEASWKPASATRYLGGLLRFAAWADASRDDG